MHLLPNTYTRSRNADLSSSAYFVILLDAPIPSILHARKSEVTVCSHRMRGHIVVSDGPLNGDGFGT